MSEAHSNRTTAADSDFIITPAFPAKDSVNIIFVSSDYYLPYCATTVLSVLSHADPARFYDIIISSIDPSPAKQRLLLSMANALKNVSIRIFDLSEYMRFAQNAWDFLPGYDSSLLLKFGTPFLCSGYRKMIICDCDTVFEVDAGRLFDFDLRGHAVAAAKDIHMKGYVRRCPDYYYNTHPGKIVKDMENYSNLGFIIIDVPAFCARLQSVKSVVDYIESNDFPIPDQDAYNHFVEGDTVFLPYEYNLFALRDNHIDWQYAPEAEKAEYLEARKNPSLIHFVGRAKPWDDISSGTDFNDRFWFYARQTPFYEEILGRYAKNVCWDYETKKEMLDFREEILTTLREETNQKLNLAIETLREESAAKLNAAIDVLRQEACVNTSNVIDTLREESGTHLNAAIDILRHEFGVASDSASAKFASAAKL